jgi:hypothetical protein
MNKLLVRLVASGLMTVTVGAGAALADTNASISLTGPDSTNIISSGNFKTFHSNVNNRVYTSNWNWQNARTGNVCVSGNTKVYGGFLGSGNARNYNTGQNNVYLANYGSSWGGGYWGGGSGNGQIFLTGPDSYNRISGLGNRSSFSSNVRNNVNATNFNAQNATTGNVTVSGNTVVSGVGGSGNASNFNQAENNVAIYNQTPTWMMGNWGPTGTAVISTTGPDSYNSISGGGNSSRVSLLTSNNVNTSNTNFQNAQSGNVTISHNTLVTGVGGSGDATNWNSAANNVQLQNM